MAESSSRFESLIDQQIRMAQERGEFDNLPGAGKPLPGRGQPDDDLWWLRQYLHREGVPADPLLPTSLQLAKEIERLPETVRDLPSEQRVRETVRELNRRVADYLRSPSGPHVPVGPVDADGMVRRWRAARLTRSGQPEAAGEEPGAARPAAGRVATAGRRRWFRRRG